MFEMPFFHRIIILLYQSENTIVNIVFRHVETAGDSTTEPKLKLEKVFKGLE
jgi:hypothetical protein